MRQVVLTGFGKDKAGEGQLNSFHWTLDNRILISTGLDGGQVKRPDGKIVSLRSMNVLLDPKTNKWELTSGGGQHGMSIDDFGRVYVSGNSDPIHTLAYDARYLGAGSRVQAPAASVNILPSGKFTRLHRISPVEPWRALRTKLRKEGKVPGSAEGGTPSGFFTGASGVTVYRGDAFPAEYHGNIFVGEVANNLVFRAKLNRMAHCHWQCVPTPTANSWLPRTSGSVPFNCEWPGRLSLCHRHVSRVDRRSGIPGAADIEERRSFGGHRQGPHLADCPRRLQAPARTAIEQGENGRVGQSARSSERLAPRYRKPIALSAAAPQRCNPQATRTTGHESEDSAGTSSCVTRARAAGGQGRQAAQNSVERFRSRVREHALRLCESPPRGSTGQSPGKLVRKDLSTFDIWNLRIDPDIGVRIQLANSFGTSRSSRPNRETWRAVKPLFSFSWHSRTWPIPGCAWRF